MDSNTEIEIISKSCLDFSTDLYKHAASPENGSIVVSPLAAYLLLSMIVNGADDSTKLQIKKGLHLPEDKLKNPEDFRTIVNSLNNVSEINFAIASGIFISHTFVIKPKFQSILESYFHSTCETLDFSKTEETADAVNTWCKEKTNNNIKEIISKNDIDGVTVLLLVNAIYFKAEWKNKFSKWNTSNALFHIDENNSKRVPTMYQKTVLSYGELDSADAKFVELPYKSQDNKFKMIIIIPNKIDGLAKIEQNIDDINFERIFENTNQEEIGLYLPSFKIESTINLNACFEKMGMTEMFSDRANFHKISDERLKVDKIIQKAIIEIDEKGTEASVVQVSLLKKCKYERPPTTILRADRPFLAIIAYGKLPLFYSKFSG